MSENVSLAANKSPQQYRTSGLAKPKQPFLQRGSGLKRRQQASMSDKRYIPKGGFVLDFAADTLAPHPMGNGSMHHKAVPKRASPSPAASKGVQEKRIPATAMRGSSPMQRAGTDAKLVSSSSSSSISRRWPAAGSAQPASRGMQPTTALRGESRQDVSPLHAPAPAGDAEMQEFRALERALGSEGGSAHSRSPIVQRRRSAGTGAVSHPSGGENNNQSGQVAALLSPAPRAEGLLAPRRGRADDSDDDEDWQDAPLLFGDLYGTAQQQPDVRTGSPITQALAGSEELRHCRHSAHEATRRQALGGAPAPQSAAAETQQCAGEREGGRAELAAAGARLRAERQEMLQARMRLEQAGTQLGLERQAFERQKAEEMAAWRVKRAEEGKKLDRERAVLNMQTRALVKLPTKKERAEIEALEAALAEQQRAWGAKEARHKLTVERLRRQVVELQEKNAELKEEVAWHEQQRLKSWAEEDGPDRGYLRPVSARSRARGKLGGADMDVLADGFGREMAKALVEALEADEGAELPSSSREAADGAVEEVQVGDRAPSGKEEMMPSSADEPLSRPEQVSVTGAGVGQAHAAAEGSREQVLLKGQQSRAVAEQHAHVGRDSEQGSQGSPSHREDAARKTGRQAPTQVVTEEAGQGSLQQVADVSGTAMQADADRAAAQQGELLQAALDVGSAGLPDLLPVEAQYDARPQRAPAKPLPPVPRFDKLQHRRDPVTGALLSSTGRTDAGWQRSAPGAAPLRLDILGGDDGLISASWGASHALAEPMSSGVPYDYGSAAVYSPLRSSMRALQLHPFAGVPAAACPPAPGEEAAAAASWESLGGGSRYVFQQSAQQAASSRPPSRSNLGSGQDSISRDGLYDASAYEREPEEDHHPSAPEDGAPGHAAGMLQDDARPTDESERLRSSGGSSSTHSRAADAAQLQEVAAPSRLEEPPVDGRTGAKSGAAGAPAGGQLQWPGSDGGSGHSLAQPDSRQQHARNNSLGMAAPGLLGHASVPVQEVRHADGKCERVFGDGRRVVTFPNGTLKEHCAEGRSVIRFPNGDVKRTLPNGRVEYFYAEVDTWHTTHADGVEVFHFPSGQSEAHHPGGHKEILFPDGAARLVHPDGREEVADRLAMSSAVQQGTPVLNSSAGVAM